MTKESGYSTKDLMMRMDSLHEADRCRHETLMREIGEIKVLAKTTNGKVKLHQKILWSLGGGVITLAVLFINHVQIGG